MRWPSSTEWFPWFAILPVLILPVLINGEMVHLEWVERKIATLPTGVVFFHRELGAGE